MHTLEIPSIKLNIQFASCIEEMTGKEFLRMMELLLQHQEGKLSIHEFRSMITFLLLDIKYSARFKTLSIAKKDAIFENLSTITDVIDSFFTSRMEDGQETLSLRLDFIKNMIPRIDRYHGPTDALTNCTYFEYKEAFTYFNQFVSTSDESILDLLIAVLYRPRKSFLWLRKMLPDYDSQERVNFTSRSNPRLLMKRAARISRLPLHFKTGIFLWFSSCVSYLREGKPLIDGNEIDLSILYNGGEENTSPGIGLTGLLFSLAENKVFGDLFETSNTGLYDILARLYQLKQEYDSQMKKLNSK